MLKFIHRHGRALMHSLSALKQTPWMTSMTGIAIGLLLLLPLLFGFLLHAFKPLMDDLLESKEISLYLVSSFNPKQAPKLVKQIEAMPQVAKAYFVSADDSLKALEKEEGMEDIGSYLPENPLPSMIEVMPAEDMDSAVKLEVMSQSLKDLPEVDEARMNREWVGKIYGLLTFLSDLTWLFAVLFGFMVIFIIRNLLSLLAQMHYEEIQVLKLVGATDAYILRPFLYTGVILGFLGALGAFVGGAMIVSRLGGALESLGVPGLSFDVSDLFSMQHLGFSLCFGALLGWLGAFFSLKYQLAHIEPCQ